MLFKLGVDFTLKRGNILPHFGNDVLKVILEFSSKAKFEFFAIHLGFSSIKKKYSY